MDIISKHYEEGQYRKCVKILADLPTHSLLEKCVVENNILVSKFQISFVQGDDLLKKSVSDDLFRLQAKLLALPHDQECTFLTLCCTSNAIYALLNNQCYEENSVKAVQVANGAFEKVLCNHQIFYYQEQHSIVDKFIGLVHQLLQCKKLKSDELSLLLYCCILTCLIKLDLKFVELVKSALDTLECSLKNETPNLNYIHIFLLSPLEMSHIQCLQSSGSYSSTICDFSRLFLSMFYCTNLSWSEALAVKSAQNSQLSEILEIFKMYASLHLASPSSDEEIEEHSNERNSYLYFARCLINAAKFALQKKPFIALKYLNFAGAGELAQTQACSIVMAYSATQFKVLDQTNFEIEALKIAEESLLKSPVFRCSIHTELPGYLLEQMKLFSLPEVSVLRYQLARILLKNQRYQEAAEEYEKLPSETPFQHKTEPFSSVFKLISPPNTIILHERILALVLSNNYEKALDAIDSSLEEDLFTLYLHAQVRAHLKQYKKAIQLINRSILKLNSIIFSVSGTKDVIRAQLCFKLSQLFDEIGDLKDAHHQLRLSFQYGISMNSKMLEFYHKFTRKLGAQKEIPIPSDSHQEELVSQILEQSDDLTLHYLLNTGFLCSV